MKPILYAPNTNIFNNNGIGPLSDCIKCIAKQSESSYELDIEYPTTGIHFKDIRPSSWLKVVVPPYYNESPQLFYVISVSKPLNKKVKIIAHHISYRLQYIPILPFTASTVNQVLQGIASHPVESMYSTFPFTFDTDQPNATIPFKMEQPTSAMSILGGDDEGSILKQVGGYYLWDNYTVHHKSSHPNHGYRLKYGVNITDITQEENITDTITGVVPFWFESRYEKDSQTSPTLLMLDEKVLYSDNADNFPFKKTITLDMSSEFDERPSKTELRDAARLWMSQNKVGVPKISMDVDFVELSKTKEFENFTNLPTIDLYDTVTVQFPDLDVDTTAIVTEYTYDVLMDRYESIHIGEFKNTLIGSMKTVNASISGLRQQALSTVASATNMITGGGGGYIVLAINPNTDAPDRLLIMNTSDTETATNVVQINQNGIGFSLGNGINGPYTSAWTIDGKFNANFIKVGTIDASQVEVTNLDADNITSGTIDADTINVEHLNADNVDKGDLDPDYVDGRTDNDITAVNWDGDLVHFYFKNGVGQRYWIEDSVYWIQAYEYFGGDGERG